MQRAILRRLPAPAAASMPLFRKPLSCLPLFRLPLSCMPLSCLLLCCLLGSWSLAAEAAERPNVVVILTDNHGAWTLGCYGNPEIRTPRIDRLAEQGMLWTRAFASNPVCSPTRATLLTGLLPSQHGVHCFLRGGRLQMGPEARSTLTDFTSLGEVLRGAGYRCGLVGKWHLGDNLHAQEGFDDYWITMPHGGTSEFYDAAILENGKQRTEPQYLTDFWTDHAVKFIEQSGEGKAGKTSGANEAPFFLMLSYNGPYALGRLLLQEGRNRHAAYYATQDLPSFPREPTHPWQFSNRDYINQPAAIRRVATEVSGVDDGVGRVLDTLERQGLAENTVVLFLADQGWVGGHGGFFGMGDHTRPLTACDGMMRIPMIWRHPGGIPAGARQDLMAANYDVLPTLLNYLGLGERMPASPRSPGRDLSSALRGEAAASGDSPRQEVFYEFEDLRCVRTERWKLVRRKPNGPHELYDLQRDPLEQDNLHGAAEHAATRQELLARLNAFFDKYAEPRYDLWNGGGSQTVLFQGLDEELAQQAPADPPRDPTFQSAALRAPEGYTVELAVGPPLVKHPMMACFDDRGRLYLAESAGLNLGAAELERQLPNFVRRLEDRDGDGRFDHSTIFADKMTLPQGALWHNGALYVASPPNIWRLEDTDDDGVADRRDVLVDKFGYTGNGASVHGCFLSPDGRIYWCDGRHGHEFRDPEGNVSSKREGSYLFSCRPDGADVRIHCGGGMDNPVEVDFTAEGDVLGTVNILYSRPRSDCLVHWLYGGAYPHSERVLGELTRTGPLLGPIHDFGHVAVSGATRYRSGVLERRFRDNLFVTIFNSGKVQRVTLERDGASYRAEEHEFLTCDSRDFHPTDVLEDADGSLLVVDTGGWFLKGCPTSQLAKPEVRGAVYRIRRRGATPLVDPRGLRIQWAGLSDKELIALLGDTRWAVQERAVTECGRRGAGLAAGLAAVIQRGDVVPCRNAVWAASHLLQQSTDPAARAAAQRALQLALRDWRASVRQAACRGLASHPDDGAVPQLIELLRDDEPSVRRVAAEALGRLGKPQAVAPLLAAAGRAGDRAEEHALIYALIEIDHSAATAEGLASDVAASQRAALVALDQMASGRLSAEQAAGLLASPDPALRSAALEVFQRHGEWSDPALEQIRLHLRAGDEPVLTQGLLTAFLGQEEVDRLWGESLAASFAIEDAARQRALQVSLLTALRDSQRRDAPADWQAPLVKLLETLASRQDWPALQLAVETCGPLKSPPLAEWLREWAARPDTPRLLRVAALRAAGGGLSSDAFELLLGLIGDGAAPTEAAQAAQMLGASPLTAEQLERLAPALRRAGPLELRELIKPFQRVRDSRTAEAFLDAIEQASSFASLQAHEYSDVIKRYPPDLLPRANRLLQQLAEQDQRQRERLESLLAALPAGDPQRGRDVFFSKQAKCSVCHRAGREGGAIGPDLTRVGRIRQRRDLLEAIVFPSSSLVREYEPYRIATEEGEVLTGLIVRETERELYVQQQVGAPVAVSRDAIRNIAPSPVSIMPKGLEQELSKESLADVIEYLRSLK